MPKKPSNPEEHSTHKKKASARQNALARIAERRGASPPTRVPTGHKQISQGRFPGEAPLTGEDRPTRDPGQKARGQSVVGVATTSGKGRASTGPRGSTGAAARRRGSPGSATRETG